MGAQLRRGQRRLAYVVRRQAVDAGLGRLRRLGETDLPQDLLNPRFVNFILELCHFLSAGFLPEAHVSAEGKRVVVEPTLLLVEADADRDDEEVGERARI